MLIALAVGGGVLASGAIELARRAVLGRRLQESMLRVETVDGRRPI